MVCRSSQLDPVVSLNCKPTRRTRSIMELFSSVDIERDFPDHGDNSPITYPTPITLTNEPEVKSILSSSERLTQHRQGYHYTPSALAYEAQEYNNGPSLATGSIIPCDYMDYNTTCATLPSPDSSNSISSTSPSPQT